MPSLSIVPYDDPLESGALFHKVALGGEALIACRQLAIPRAKLGWFVKAWGIDDPGGVGSRIADPFAKGLVADAHVARGGPLRFAASQGITHGGEPERLGEMPPRIARRPGIGHGRGKGRKTRGFE